MQMISVDIMHRPMDLENISDLDLKADTPCLDNEADPCPEADHSPALSDLHADQPHCQTHAQTSHPPADTSHPPA